LCAIASLYLRLRSTLPAEGEADSWERSWMHTTQIGWRGAWPVTQHNSSSAVWMLERIWLMMSATISWGAQAAVDLVQSLTRSESFFL
jgi:hypothetical protein